MRAAAAAPAGPARSLTRPTFGSVLRTGLPGFLREGALPLGAFYGGVRLGGLTAGIAASTAFAFGIYVYERRAGRDALLVRLSLAFVVLQGAIGLASDSTTVYLAQPVVATAVWGLAFLVSVPLRRPLAGALACAWYPFPRRMRETAAFRRVFGIESVVWGSYFIARSAIRLVALRNGGVEGFLLVTILTGTPLTLVLVAWSIRFALRSLDDA